MQTCCIIIPCYNEAARLDADRIEKCLEQRQGIMLVFVNDGSTDTTYELLQSVRERHPEQIYLLNLDSNSGKAEAVRQGILFAIRVIKPAFAGYMDADLATPFGEMDRLFSYLESHEPVKVVFGSRVKRMGSLIRRTYARHYLGRILATFISILLRLPVYDSQCGAKAMTAAMAETLFRDKFITSWLFDVELLCRHMILYGTEITLQEVYEYPLYEWTERQGSKIRLFHLIAIPSDLARIFLHYKRFLR